MSEIEFLTRYLNATENVQKAVREILELQENATPEDVKRIADKYGITTQGA